MKALSVVIAGFLVLHGLIHLMGAVTYMKLGAVQGLTYKTKIFGGRLDLGETGISFYGALWAVVTLGLTISATALLFGWGWWRPVLIGAALFSLTLTGLDWKEASVGAILNIIILAWLWFLPIFMK